MRKLSTLFVGLFFVIVFASYLLIIYFFKCPTELTNSFVEALIGGLYGTLVGAAIVYGFQLRMERARYFQTAFEKGQQIMADTNAWEKVEDTWKKVEFRKAVGTATWTNDPTNHMKLYISKLDDCKEIDWIGVAYKIDDQFCVASKALQEYATWFRTIRKV